MKVVFTLGSALIGGGTNVILEHASKMKEFGEDVYIVTEKKVKPIDYSWHSKAHKLKWITLKEAKSMNFDIAIGTWWATIYYLYKINAKKYLYFVQSIESRFYNNNEEGLKLYAEMTYLMGLKVITEATWIKEYLESKYNNEVILVRNGIRKDVFTLDGEKYPECDGLRVLVEGPVDVPFKNVPKTIKLVRKSKASEIWLLTSSDVNKYPGVDKVFSRVPVKDCAKIYRSCDVIVKLSYVEGMFGPPLEMFHTGGTAIVYDVTGHDEYIINGYNGIVIKTDDEDQVVKSINKLLDKKLLTKYKSNAIKTADEWIDWDTSSKQFYDAVKKYANEDSVSQIDLEVKANFYQSIYEMYENKSTSLKRKIGDFGRQKFPKLYGLYYKLVSKKYYKR